MQFKDLRMKYAAFQQRRGWFIWVISLLFVVFQFCVQFSAGQMVDGLMQSFSLTAFGGGLLVSAYYYIYVLLQTPAGVLIDHYGPRLLLTVGALTCGLGTFMFAESHTLSMAFIARIIMGSGAAVGFVGSLSILSRWFPANQFGPMVGVLEMVGMLSATIGGYWIARWIQLTNWRVFMLGAGTFIIVIALLSWLIIRDQPRKLMKRIFRTKKEFLEDVSRLLKSRIAWVNGVYSGLLFSMATVFTALWGVNFIRLSHHVSLGVATISCNLLFAGIAVGGLSMGWLDNQILNRKKLCIGSPLTAAITLGLVIYVPSLPVWLMMLCIALTGFFISTYVLTFVVSSEIATSATRATSVGFTNMLSVGTAPILQPLVGFILACFKHYTRHPNSIHYQVYYYQWALGVLMVCLIAAAVLGHWMPLRKLR